MRFSAGPRTGSLMNSFRSTKRLNHNVSREGSPACSTPSTASLLARSGPIGFHVFAATGVGFKRSAMSGGVARGNPLELTPKTIASVSLIERPKTKVRAFKSAVVYVTANFGPRRKEVGEGGLEYT